MKLCKMRLCLAENGICINLCLRTIRKIKVENIKKYVATKVEVGGLKGNFQFAIFLKSTNFFNIFVCEYAQNYKLSIFDVCCCLAKCQQTIIYLLCQIEKYSDSKINIGLVIYKTNNQIFLEILYFESGDDEELK